MNFHVLTLFPEMIENGMNTSITGRAITKGLLTLEAVNIRDYAFNKHQKVDDYTYGGGAGMLMQAEPVYLAYEAIANRTAKKPRVVYLTPQGQVFNQAMAREMAQEEDLVFLCGHYEGIDERVLEEIVTDYVSIGDYVLTGGELPAMVMMDSISRMVPGVLNNQESGETESFAGNLLEYPQYSRPEEWHGKKVPEVLMSGHHANIEKWRREQSIYRTAKRRPDLLKKADLTNKEWNYVRQLRKQWKEEEEQDKMKTSDFYYDLPQELIAQDPLEDRSSSRLMHLSLKDGSIEHRHFTDVLDYMEEGDCLVINDTKVIPARLYGHKEETGALIEILLLKRRENDIWECLVKPGKKARPGAKITFGNGILKGKIIDVVDEGNRLIQFHYEGIFEEILDQLGEMPLPPYITHKLKDKNRYQTVYAKNEGSAAAPTAGLHFTKELLEKVKEKGVNIAHVTLHVGLGTFRPVKVDDVESHHMHSEFYIVEEDQAKLINDTKKAGKRVIAVGTTSCRTLESATGEDGILKAGSGWTEIFIYPGYHFKMIDALITNFHLPESTLVMLVSALAGKENIMHAYEVAVQEKYRFFSFGDAMIII